MGTTGLRVPRKILLNDLVTGLVMAVINVPQALANGVLAGVNPVFGLYLENKRLCGGRLKLDANRTAC